MNPPCFPSKESIHIISPQIAINTQCSLQSQSQNLPKLYHHELMEDTTWEQRIQAMTHLLTSPTQNPSLHSQFFISSQVPCYLKWSYPPILCKNGDNLLHLKWGISLFLKRVSRLGYLETSWRSKCPFQQPPPLILAKGVEPAPLQCGDEQMRVYLRKRLRRKRLGNDVNPLIPFLVPNLLLFVLLLVDPFPVEE